MQRVKDLMTKKVVTIPCEIGIEQICIILSSNSLSGVPVVNEKSKLIGFVSERDIVDAIAVGNYAGKKAKDIMRIKITTVKEDALISEVSKIFACKPFRHLPVIRSGEVVGVISRRDIFRKLVES